MGTLPSRRWAVCPRIGLGARSDIFFKLLDFDSDGFHALSLQHYHRSVFKRRCASRSALSVGVMDFAS